jgi:23S rRNA (cytidine2498-2'-O)-methyltransferase
MPQFLFVTCQVGAADAVKRELGGGDLGCKFAFSRPGFLTFKLPEDRRLPDDWELSSVFARAYGFSLGKIAADDVDELAKAAWELFGKRPFRRIHAWPRDAAEPGYRDFEPGLTDAALEAHTALLRHCPRPSALAADASDPTAPAKAGDIVFDCCLVEPREWWIGYHRAESVPSRWPGGFMPLRLPANAVSRTWLKMEEGLRWSQLPIPAGARVAEIGSAPGGASQALLARDLIVTGIDPAEMAEIVLNHPRFTHIRRRSTQVRRREFRKIRWLTADMNVAPNYTLDAVEGIVTYPEVNVRGMLLTLKLPEWDLTDRVNEYLARVRSWGYNLVSARQLQHDRREFCVSALQKPFRKKSGNSTQTTQTQ